MLQNDLRRAMLRLLAFLAVFAALQWGWEQGRGGWAERAWIERTSVPAAVAVLQWVDPGAQATAAGRRIAAPGGGLTVLAGCEGVELLFLVAAAVLAYPAPWRARVWGLLAGAAAVFVLNTARLVVLFVAAREHRSWFDWLHTTALPLVLVVVLGAAFLLWAHGLADRPAAQA